MALIGVNNIWYTLVESLTNDIFLSETQLSQASFLEKIINNIKTILVEEDLNAKAVAIATLFLFNEKLENLEQASHLRKEELKVKIFGITETKYLQEANDLIEDAPVNNAGAGNVAGIGVGPKGEPGYRAKGKFRGCKIFEVEADSFYSARFGKNRYHTYRRYVGEDETGEDIRWYGRKNPKEGIILQHPTTGIMTFLKFPQKKV